MIGSVVGDFRNRDSDWVKSFRMNGRHIFTIAGKLHNNMMSRCETKSYKSIHSTYKDVSASDNFKDFQFFAEWCQTQVGYSQEGWDLDKDLVVPGNKVYHENRCVFLPRNINMLLIGGGTSNSLPSNVIVAGWGFQGQLRLGGTRVSLQIRSTPDEAFEDVKEFKELYISEVAEKYKHALSQKAYEALKNYQFVNKSKYCLKEIL